MFEPIFLGMARLAQAGGSTGGGRFPEVPNPPDAPAGASPEVKQKASDCYWYWTRLHQEGRQLPISSPPGFKLGPYYSRETLELVGQYRKCLEEYQAELEFVGPRQLPEEPYKYPEFGSAPFVSNDPQDRPYPSPAAGDIPRPQPPYERVALACPDGQYRPEGSGWCVPIPVATGYQGLRTVPYGSVFGGGFFGGSQGVSAGSFM